MRVDLLAVIEYIEQFPGVNDGFQLLRSNQVSHESPQNEGQRMQFLYGLLGHSLHRINTLMQRDSLQTGYATATSMFHY